MFIFFIIYVNNNNNNISFTSRLTPVLLTEFTKASEPLYRTAFVKYPWTIKDSVIAKDAFTMDIYDCSAGGIIDKKNKRVFLFHICPEMKENASTSDIVKHIMSVFPNGEDLRAFLVGSNKMFKDSVEMYEKIKMAILERKIPLSEFKGTSEKTHILCNAENDQWLISATNINTKLQNGKQPQDVVKECFDEVVVDSGDTLL